MLDPKNQKFHMLQAGIFKVFPLKATAHKSQSVFCFLRQGDPVCLPQINCQQTSMYVQRGNILVNQTKNAENSGFPRIHFYEFRKYSPKSENFSGFCFLGCRGAFPQINCFQTRSNCNSGRRETFFELDL